MVSKTARAAVNVSLGLLFSVAALFVGFMILGPFVQIDWGSDLSQGEAMGALVLTLFGGIGLFAMYLGGMAFTIVALIFGIKMLKRPARDRLISYTVRMLIATCVLLEPLFMGVITGIVLFPHSQLGVFPLVYLFVIAVVYLASLAAQIAAVAILKRLPQEGSGGEIVPINEKE